MHVDDDRGRGAGLSELFDADREGERVEPRASVLARDQDPHQARLGSRPDSLFREAVVAIDLCGQRQDGALRELAHDGAKGRVLGRDFEIQLMR